MNIVVNQKTTKITLSVPIDILDDYKKLVGQRKVSHAVTQIMVEQLKWEKRKKALIIAKKIGHKIDKERVKISTQELINSYKEYRKY